MRVSIIIRCYNEEKFIGRLLSGIMEQTVKDIEIIVVDSGSNDATISIASRYPVKIIRIEKEKFTFGKSLNLGCAEASGDILVFASAHVYPVYKNWIEEMLAPFDDSRIGLVYGKQIGNSLTKYSERQIFASWFPNTSNLEQRHPFCNNANAAVRRELWEQYPYDEILTGLEDLDWARRIMEARYKVAYSAEALIVHVHDETLKRIYNRYRREAMAMKHIYPEQMLSIRSFCQLLTTNIFFDLVHAAREGVLKQHITSIFTFRLMQFWGTYQGFRQSPMPIGQLRRTFYYPRTVEDDRRPHTLFNNENNRIDYSTEFMYDPTGRKKWWGEEEA